MTPLITLLHSNPILLWSQRGHNYDEKLTVMSQISVMSPQSLPGGTPRLVAVAFVKPPPAEEATKG
jgi:hypothetical protein